MKKSAADMVILYNGLLLVVLTKRASLVCKLDDLFEELVSSFKDKLGTLTRIINAHTVAHRRIECGGVDVICYPLLSFVCPALGGALALYGHYISKLDTAEGYVTLAYSLADYEKGCIHILGENVVIKRDGNVFCIHQNACADKGEGDKSDDTAPA